MLLTQRNEQVDSLEKKVSNLQNGHEQLIQHCDQITRERDSARNKYMKTRHLKNVKLQNWCPYVYLLNRLQGLLDNMYLVGNACRYFGCVDDRIHPHLYGLIIPATSTETNTSGHYNFIIVMLGYTNQHSMV